MSDKIKKKNIEPKKIETPKKSNFQNTYPIFCFKHLQTTPKSDFKFYADFIVRLTKLSSLSWADINISHRHSFGTEKMPVKKIKPSLPKFITQDVDSLTVFRANGDNRPFLGLQKENIFHIIFIEEKFGDIYDHE
jgi:hypothetical protein